MTALHYTGQLAGTFVCRQAVACKTPKCRQAIVQTLPRNHPVGAQLMQRSLCSVRLGSHLEALPPKLSHLLQTRVQVRGTLSLSSHRTAGLY